MTFITATVYKASPDRHVGIGLRAVNQKVYISSVAQGRPFSRTDLNVGQRVLKINGKDCYGMTTTQAITLVESTTGNLTILATDEVTARPTSSKQAAPEQPAQSFHPRGTSPGGQW